MQETEKQKLLAFFDERDEDGLTNREKIAARAKVIRRVATTDKSRSFEQAETPKPAGEWPLGVVEENGKLIGLGIHIYNEDVYPIQSFEIYLRDCGLTGTLDLTSCRDLIFTDLYRNRLSAVKLGDNPALRILGVQENRLETLDPTGLAACQGIDAGKNRLERIDVSRNAELVELYLNDNRFTEVDLRSNPLLRYFYCHRNRLTELDTTANPFLRHLNATENPLRHIRCLAPQREGSLPLELTAGEGGCVGLRFQPVYNAQWKETGEWEQSYFAYPDPGFRFLGWFSAAGEKLCGETQWTDTYGASRVLTARFEKVRIVPFDG